MVVMTALFSVPQIICLVLLSKAFPPPNLGLDHSYDLRRSKVADLISLTGQHRAAKHPCHHFSGDALRQRHFTTVAIRDGTPSSGTSMHGLRPTPEW